jgi:catechol 2,3-dioxygenase-like lactoylglutathione lyase family enzyme
MIDHIEIHTRDVDAHVRFYTDLLAPLGYTLKMDGPVKGFGVGTRLDFFIGEGAPSRDVHYAFAAASRATVDAIHATGLAAGHRLDRAPMPMPHIHPGYYAGFFRDPDGRLIEFACHAPEAAMAA